MIQAIRRGLIMAIPILMIGSIALLLRSLPMQEYQEFIRSFFSGFLYEMFGFVHTATFGMLSIYMTLFIAYSYSQQFSSADTIWVVSLSVACFALSCGLSLETFSIDDFGVRGTFMAILSALVAVKLYHFFLDRKFIRFCKYSGGADIEFNRAISVIFPVLLTILVFAAANMFVMRIFEVNGMQELLVVIFEKLFQKVGNSWGGSILYVMLTSVLWFFGIHGGNVLDGVSESLFMPGVQINQEMLASGLEPTEIFTKTFFETFVVMGGCGATMCLVIAVVLFSRQRMTRRLGKLAAAPMLFNINEPVVFGLPVVLNPTLLIPFILAPLACMFTSAFAMKLGLVPVTIKAVEWTTPILLSGYAVTGSIAGSLLQLFNLVVGICIYMPFVHIYDKSKVRFAHQGLDRLITELQESQDANKPVKLTERKDAAGELARSLADELETALETDEIMLFYQPQFNQDGKCFGAEALMRWKHPNFGMMYPPLVVQLAEELDLGVELDSYVLKKAVADYGKFSHGNDRMKLSVNASPNSLFSSEFDQLLDQIMESGQVKRGAIWIEVTEQVAVNFDALSVEKFRHIRESGYPMAIDDFSMGSTSLKYIQNSQFDMIKLDGSLVKGLKQQSGNSIEIISSIAKLAEKLGFLVLAEFVETEEDRAKLEAVGCLLYQGYLYSPAVPAEEFIKIWEKDGIASQLKNVE